MAEMGEESGIEKYFSKMARKEKPMKVEEEYDGENGLYLVYGENGRAYYVMINFGLNFTCGCLGFLKGGLCSHIYTVAKYLIKSGKMTEADFKKYYDAVMADRRGLKEWKERGGWKQYES